MAMENSSMYGWFVHPNPIRIGFSIAMFDYQMDPNGNKHWDNDNDH
jgi:hypothetical protein